MFARLLFFYQQLSPCALSFQHHAAEEFALKVPWILFFNWVWRVFFSPLIHIVQQLVCLTFRSKTVITETVVMFAPSSRSSFALLSFIFSYKFSSSEVCVCFFCVHLRPYSVICIKIDEMIQKQHNTNLKYGHLEWKIPVSGFIDCDIFVEYSSLILLSL